jgi:NAD(P)-dependent dehydrogenase (short-subunit alcohol dehydrogenase family)
VPESNGVDLTGKAAVVTGAAQGIGLAVAEAFAAAGAGVVLVDVDEARVAAAAAELTRSGHAAVGVAADVGDEEAVERAADAVTGDLG